MLLNTFRLAVRHLARHKTFSFINIGGLAVSLASCILIFYFVYDEFTYDRFHEKSSRIYRLTVLFKTPEDTQNLLWTDQKIGPRLKREYPQVEDYVRINDIDAGAIFNKTNKETKGIIEADASILNIFTYPLIEGNPNTALTNLRSIVISESLAKKYFHGMAMGQFVEINNQPYTVTGVMKDVPSNTDKWVNAIAHGEFGGEESPNFAFGYQTYILLKNNEDPAFIRNIVAKPSQKMNPASDDGLAFGYDMQALTDLHFWTGTGMDNPKGNEANTKILAVVAIVLLLVALFNFINLTTVISLERAKEVGVRKVAGAQRGELIRQFLGESVVAVVIAAASASILIILLRSVFTSISDKQPDIRIIGCIVFLLIAAVIVSSIYPASILSSYRPVKALRNQKEVHGGGNILRKILTTAQFGLSTALLIFLTTVLVQTDFMRANSPGFTKEKIIVVDMPGDSAARAHAKFYADEFMKVKSVSKVGIGGFASIPGTTDVTASPVKITVNGQERNPVISNTTANGEYTEILGLNAVNGKSLHDFKPNEIAGKAIVNESFLKLSGWKDPIGEKLETYAGSAEIVGVIPDFHFKSLHNKIEPMIIIGHSRDYDSRYIFIKTTSNDIDELRLTWQRMVPDHPFEYHFLNDYFDQQYKAETTLQTIFFYFTLITIIIAGSGLLGLTIYHVEKKTKEISIRKVLGAPVSSLIKLLSKEFFFLTIAGIVLGTVAGSIFASRWLSGFAYHIEPGIKTLILPVAIIMAIAGLILVYKTYQGSNKNPMHGLKHE